MSRPIGTLVLALSFAACGNDSGPTGRTTTTTTVPTASQAQISVIIDPNPITAVPSGMPEYPWEVNFTARIRETAGLAVDVNFIDVLLGDPIPPLNFGAAEIRVRAGTNHIPANGSLDVPLAIVVSLREETTGYVGSFNVLVNCTDARGNTAEDSATALLNVGSSSSEGELGVLKLRKR